MRGLTPPVGTAEAISQVVTGLTIGDTYQVEYVQTHLGFAYPPTPTRYTGCPLYTSQSPTART